MTRLVVKINEDDDEYTPPAEKKSKLNDEEKKELFLNELDNLKSSMFLNVSKEVLELKVIVFRDIVDQIKAIPIDASTEDILHNAAELSSENNDSSVSVSSVESETFENSLMERMSDVLNNERAISHCRSLPDIQNDETPKSSKFFTFVTAMSILKEVSYSKHNIPVRNRRALSLDRANDRIIKDTPIHLAFVGWIQPDELVYNPALLEKTDVLQFHQQKLLDQIETMYTYVEKMFELVDLYFCEE